jgi:peptide/nickel transport system permease protein
LVIVAYSVPSYARLVRSQVLSLKQRDFVIAARAMNVPVAAILVCHLLPNVAGALLIVACMDVATVIGLDTGLSFLGLSADTRVPDWGMILADGFAAIRATPMLVIAGAVPLVLATLGFTFFGEALNDALDPKLDSGR